MTKLFRRITMNRRVVLIAAISTLMILALTILGFIISDYNEKTSYEDMKDYQNEVLEILNERVGDYDEKSIVLYDTNEREAKELADRLGARLRINKSGNFATLTLTDESTILDVFSNDENLDILKHLSADWSAEISESEEYERIPESPNYNVTDNLYPYQSYIDYLNIGDAWLSYNGSGITVAVIDTGIDTDHPEFAGRISEYSYNASENKIVKDYRTGSGSYDWSLIEDEQGHGTAVAGTLGAAMNGKGTVGIAPNVTIVVIKAECDEHGNFRRSSDLVFGLYYAIERDVDVVNMSFGSSGINIYEDAARLGRDSDILMVAAAGNNGTATPIYPAADENVIGVGALADNSWELAEYSTYGESVDIVAPGTVYTTTIGGEYKTINGTSFSSPMVAASLALMKSNYTYRYAANAEIIEILYASAYDLGDLGPDYYFGYGAIDVDALIHGARGVVTFDYLTDDIDETEQVFISGNPLQNIPEPERLYCIFDGWYYDIECTEPLELYHDAFKSDLTLYAKWVNEDDGIPYTYVILDDGTIEIRSYTGHRKYITVPEIIENRIVSSIGDFAFKNQSKLREVQLPDTIEHIGLSAFDGCSNLVSVNIPDSVTEIEAYAFKDAIRLSYIVIRENSKLKSIGDFAFQACFNLKTIDLPETLVQVNGSAFLGAVSLRKINVDKDNSVFSSTSGILFNKSKTELVAYPASLTEVYSIPEITHTIGKYAFAYSAVSSIDLNNVRTVGDYAFISSGINELVIPNSVTNLGASAFASCTNLSTVKIGTGVTDISNSAFKSTTSLKYVEIPGNIMNIGGKAFAGSGLTGVSFSEDGKLVTIGEEAFSFTLVEKISIPKSVSQIDSGAFSQCYNLNQVTFADGISLQSIGAQAFAKTISLTEIAFPESLRIIGSKAFEGSGISGTVTIPASVEKLGAGAFASCHKLTDFAVAAQNSVYVAYNGVVYTKDGKTVVVYPAGNTSTEYSLRSGTKTVGASAFEGSKNLKKVKITDGVTSISDFGFYKCEGVTGYTLPSTLEEIGQHAFSENYSLSSVSIPDNVISVGSYAFAFDDNLRSITISDSTKMSRIGFAAFAFTGVTSFRVPANISSIAQYAFEGCDNLSSVTFAKNSKLESISAYMFIGADNINSIKFEQGSALTSIQAHGFEGMTNLQTVDFGNAELTNIDNYAFRYCSSLESLTLPETLENIGRYAFYKCSLLSELSIPVATEHIGAYAFYGSNNCNLYFTSDYLPVTLDENWDSGLGGYYTGVKSVVTSGKWKYAIKTNGNIAIIKYLGSDTVVNLNNVSLGGKIDSIGGYAFEGCGITSITLPDSLIEIQRYAFAGTKNLTKVTLPKNLKYIASYAFANSAVQSVSFAGNSVEIIEKYAFAYTDNLVSITLPSSIKTLGSCVFYESGLTSLTFASGFSLTEIPESAFAGTSISSVIIPDSVTRIHSSAFRDNMNLKSVTLGSGEDLRIDANAFYNTGINTLYIPENVRYIGEYSFIGLVGLKNYQVDKNNPNYTSVDGVLYNKDKTKLIAFPAGREGSFEIPAYVESIGFGAFENTSLSSVTFADGINLLTLGWRAFYNAGNITEITLPESLISIDYYAFAGCKNLTTVNFAENNKIKGIYEGAFFGCQRLENITIPDSIVEISEYAFYGCMSLDQLPVSENSGIKGIFDYAFAYTAIKDLTIPEGVIDIGNYAFRGALLEKVYISDTNAEELIIGIGAFEECNNIEEITIPFIGASYEDSKITWFGYIFGAGGYEANSTYVPESLKTVNIHDGLTVIPLYAFYELDKIERISVPDSVIYLEYGSFYNTTAKYELTNEISIDGDTISNYHIGRGICGELKLSEGIKCIYYFTFNECSSLTSVILPSGVESIKNQAFCYCKSLESIIIPDSVTEICDYAFSECSSLKSLTLPDSLISVGIAAFSGCSSITSIIIPSNVKNIGDNAFAFCTSLSKATISHGVTAISELFFYGCTSLKTVTIPTTVTSIGKSAFYGCKSLENITIPSSVTDIGGWAFKNCSSLTSIVLPDSVTRIESGVFDYCSSLNIFTIPKNITYVSDSAFSNCVSLFKVINLSNLELSFDSLCDSINIIEDAKGNCYYRDTSNGTTYLETSDRFIFKINGGEYTLVAYLGDNETITLPKNINGFEYKIRNFRGGRNVIIPDGVTSIANNAFSGCESLTGISIPDSVISIGENAFHDCESLTNVRLPKNLTEISYGLFSSCSSLETIIIPEAVKSISDFAFSHCASLNNIVIPDGVTSIGDHAFSTCSSLTSLVLPDGIKSISYGIFYDCESLESINIPDGVTSIGESAFNGCISLQSISIPDGVTSIGESAFNGCVLLETINIPNSVNRIDNVAFAKTKISNVLIDDNHPYFTIYNGILYSKDYSDMIYVLFGVKEAVLPSDWTTVPRECFYGAETLEKIIIPNGVTSIGAYAFRGCTSLTQITIPESVTSIDDCAFSGCSSLESIIIPNGVTSIGISAFGGCSSLVSITIPSGVTSIESATFTNCTSLRYVSLPDNLTSIGGNAFGYCSSLESINIPEGVTKIEKSTFYHCDSLRSATLPESITDIGKEAFSCCYALENINIPKSVTNIGEEAFYVCSSLTSIEIPDGLTSLGSGAFLGCRSLKSVKIPDGITSIGESVFWSCDSLISVSLPDGLTSIGREAFAFCRSLYKITIPESVTSIGDSAFLRSDSIIKVINKSSLDISFASDDSTYLTDYVKVIEDSNGNLYYKTESDGTTYIEKDSFIYSINNNTYTLIGYVGSESTITLPQNINGRTYKMWCFRGGVNVIIPEGVTSIERDAFNGCSSLVSVQLPSSLKSIGSSAFYNCTSLTSIVIPDGVSLIDYSAFNYCLSLENISIPDSVTNIGSYAFKQTAYYNNSDNWSDGALYIGNHLIAIDTNTTSFVVRENIKAICESAFEDCHILTTLTVFGDREYLLSGITNLETLIITSLPEHSIHKYFGYFPESTPVTLSKVILKSGCDVKNNELFYGINGVMIFVEDEKEACPWNNDYPGWNNGNKVLYGGEWHYVNYYDAEGDLITTHYYSASEVIKPPCIYSYKDKDISYEFDGWDMDGDGIADSLPATINKNYDLKVVVKEKKASYVIKFMDKDGKTVLYTYELSYGQKIPTPQNPTKTGYDFLSWTEYPQTASEDIKIYSQWSHRNGGHNYVTRVVAPTCTGEGYTLNTCTVCGESYKTNKIPMKEHSFGEWIVESPATCSQDGWQYRTCSCGENQRIIIESDGHSYRVSKETKSTCTTGGYATYVCADCGATTTEQLPLSNHEFEKKYANKSWLEWIIDIIFNIIFGYEGNQAYYYQCKSCNHIATAKDSNQIGGAGVMAGCQHQLGDWTTVLEPSCIDGCKVRYCVSCNEVVEAIVIDANSDHTYDIIITHPTCVDAGYTTYNCKICNYSEIGSYTSPTGHTAASPVAENRVDSTCSTYGSYDAVTYCTYCGIELSRDTVIVEKLDHKASAPVIENRVKATCSTNGSYDNVTYCADCRVELLREKVIVERLDHNAASPVIENRIESNCIKEGSYESVVYCSVCNVELSRETQVIPKGDHNYSKDWTIDVPPTYTTEGSKSHHCLVCDQKTDITVVPALHHTPSSEVIENRIEPTCSTVGSYDIVTYCIDCGNEVSRNTVIVPKLDHKASAAVVENRVNPTCSTAGSYENVVYCSVCTVEVSRKTVTIEKLDHKASVTVVENRVNPTCSTAGSYENVIYCSVCAAEISRESVIVEKLGHKASVTVVENRVNPTCSTAGSYENVIYCSVCAAEISREIVSVEKLGHKASVTVIENRVNPTCSTSGSYDSVIYCTDCGIVISRDTVYMDKLDHRVTKYVSNNDATYTEDGTKTGKCENCGEIITVTDVGTALGMAKKFRDVVDNLSVGKSHDSVFDELRYALEVYSSLTEEEKAEVADAYATLIKAVEAYNDNSSVANNELAKASELSLSAIVMFNFAFLSALWWLLKKKFLI